jgi:hypothetical protein
MPKRSASTQGHMRVNVRHQAEGKFMAVPSLFFLFIIFNSFFLILIFFVVEGRLYLECVSDYQVSGYIDF